MSQNVKGQWLVMHIPKWVVFLIMLLLASLVLAENQPLESRSCMGCHGIDGFAVPQLGGGKRQLHVDRHEYARGVHKHIKCVECHTDIQRIPHPPLKQVKVDCMSCHQRTWQAAQQAGTTEQYLFLGTVVKQIEPYRQSIHAQPSKSDPSRPNAYCSDCHKAHYISAIYSDRGNPGRLKIPDICGQCHAKQRAAYANSVHGEAVLGKENAYAAVCVDCHTTHAIATPKSDRTKLVIAKNCGNCHQQSLKTYMATYHGQISFLGEQHTAKCYSCHGSHEIKRVADPASIVHKNNRLATCAQCHKHAGDGFVSFEPHGNVHDAQHFPVFYVVKKCLLWVLALLVVFFYVHSALWVLAWYRERDKNRGKTHVDVAKLVAGQTPEKYIQRFAGHWQVLHLGLAVCVVSVIFTGITRLYSTSDWAPLLVEVLGGLSVVGLIHLCGGVALLIALFAHIAYLIMFVLKNRHSWHPFGPNSLLPNRDDVRCLWGMLRWFLDKGPRPRFDRWTYWEKFDYWALLLGLTVLGGSGMLLWVPEWVSAFLPGWVFNISALVHGEEAFLAVLLLISVHIFNSHFRPDHFACMPLHEYQQEHALSYQRLLDSGELEKYLLDPPSKPRERGSKVLGFVLIAIGLFELVWMLKEIGGL